MCQKRIGYKARYDLHMNNKTSEIQSKAIVCNVQKYGVLQLALLRYYMSESTHVTIAMHAPFRRVMQRKSMQSSAKQRAPINGIVSSGALLYCN